MQPPKNIERMLAAINNKIVNELRNINANIGDSFHKGEASENVWAALLRAHLPARFAVSKGLVADESGNFSDQIDLIIHDRIDYPLLFKYDNQVVVPVESVRVVIEVKQNLDRDNVRYARKKLLSVGKLVRRADPYAAERGNPPRIGRKPIAGGIVTLHNDWSALPNDALFDALGQRVWKSRLDFGCVATRGFFELCPPTTTLQPGESRDPEARRSGEYLFFDILPVARLLVYLIHRVMEIGVHDPTGMRFLEDHLPEEAGIREPFSPLETEATSFIHEGELYLLPQ